MGIKIGHMEAIPNGSYLLRVGPEGWAFGDPYEMFMAVVDLGDGRCEVRGLDKPMGMDHWRAAASAMRLQGFHTAVFDRIKAGVKHRREIALRDDFVSSDACPLTGICCPVESSQLPLE